MKDPVTLGLYATVHASPGGSGPSLESGVRPPVSEFRDEPQETVSSTGEDGLSGNRAVCRARALRLHPAFNQLDLTTWLIGTESHGKPHGIVEPILATDKGILVSGFAGWHAAACAGNAQIHCTEFALSDDEALQLILNLHRPRLAWNDFIRTELALQQVSYFEALPARGAVLWVVRSTSCKSNV
jgi:hypothetical protein